MGHQIHKEFRKASMLLCVRLGVDPKDVVEAVREAGGDDIMEQLLGEIFEDLKLVDRTEKSPTRDKLNRPRILAESQTNMGTPEMIGKIDSVMDMMDFDEGRYGFRTSVAQSGKRANKALRGGRKRITQIYFL